MADPVVSARRISRADAGTGRRWRRYSGHSSQRVADFQAQLMSLASVAVLLISWILACWPGAMSGRLADIATIRFRWLRPVFLTASSQAPQYYDRPAWI